MRKFLSAICASVLTSAVAITGVMPASAAPTYIPAGQQTLNTQPSDIIQVDHRGKWRKHGGNWEGNRRHHSRRHWHGNDHRYGWYNGHRGYRYKRPGYRYYDGWWYPGGAFIAGAIIGGAIANSNDNYPRYSGGGSAHVRWCYDRYRSYRAYDNTYQPYNGGRRQCYSPYN